MAPKGKRAKATEKSSLTTGLVKALEFISVAQKKEGSIYQTHCYMGGNRVVAFDGILAAGQHIEEDLLACPQTSLLISALSKCSDNLAITQLANDRLSIKSEKFKAIIPCVSREALHYVVPDAPCAVIDNRLRSGFEKLAPLVSDSAEHVLTSSFLLQANSMLATNRHVMVEFWHGIDLPPNIILPKACAVAICKTNKNLVQFGFSPNSVTFYFDDNSWIKSQLYSEAWPGTSKIFKYHPDYAPIPERFFETLDIVKPFSESGNIYFLENALSSHANAGEGASYEFEGLPNDLVFNQKYLELIKSYATHIDFIGENGISYFYGENIRGAISRISPKET